MKSVLIALAAVAIGLITSPHSAADTILYYDSVSGGTSNALDRLDGQTNGSFVASSSATTTLGSNAVFTFTHASQSQVQGLGDGLDKQFRFGSSAGGSGTMSGTLRVAHMANGPYIEMSFTAAQDMILDEFSFKLFNNSNSGSNYGSRDAGLFVKVSSDDFSQFGNLFTSATNNGNQGTVTFSDTREVAAGDLVVLRIAFTDRTRSNNDNQAATRIGAIDISATAGIISDKLRVLTYNIHGGKGPSGQGTPFDNLTAFRDTLMQNEDVLCLQEVDNGDCWTAVQDVFFEDYPYHYRTFNNETYIFSFPFAQTSILILSKYPFVSDSEHSQLIQTDPQGDRWERHAQHVKINIGGKVVDIFNFHNTYNFFDNESESEKSGLIKFRDNYVLPRLGISSVSEGERLIMLGDFNLLQSNVTAILAPPELKSNGLDHVASAPFFTNEGVYTSGQLSDHNGVWASLDLAAPTSDPMTWASAPAEAGTTSITMTATAVSDPDGVDYYFTNTNFPSGTHDSGWQSSPVYVDTGLSPATNYSYTVQARDRSQNLNETDASAPSSAYTDDGDSLPNEWELLYFPDLNTSSGNLLEDWDSDGLSDMNEWIAGTDPTDSSSLFRARIQVGDPGEIDVLWDAVAGKTYRIYSSSTMDDDWSMIANDLPAVVPESSYSVTVDEDDTACFYRVEVIQ
ncbi:endonuclease/exonuclease/phosphatase family protein [Haloferula sp.]|uniref:endonuclease/exonuclease/phosphatase family protein n=1 Tax=Haloferula sp. TaxID=2497595 RepID=UPI0032A060C4